jgi:hypothetical protein
MPFFSALTRFGESLLAFFCAFPVEFSLSLLAFFFAASAFFLSLACFFLAMVTPFFDDFSVRRAGYRPAGNHRGENSARMDVECIAREADAQ